MPQSLNSFSYRSSPVRHPLPPPPRPPPPRPTSSSSTSSWPPASASPATPWTRPPRPRSRWRTTTQTSSRSTRSGGTGGNLLLFGCLRHLIFNFGFFHRLQRLEDSLRDDDSISEEQKVYKQIFPRMKKLILFFFASFISRRRGINTL